MALTLPDLSLTRRHLAQILEPPTGPRHKRVTFAGGFLHWQDPGGLRTQVCFPPLIGAWTCANIWQFPSTAVTLTRWHPHSHTAIQSTSTLLQDTIEA